MAKKLDLFATWSAQEQTILKNYEATASGSGLNLWPKEAKYEFNGAQECIDGLIAHFTPATANNATKAIKESAKQIGQKYQILIMLYKFATISELATEKDLEIQFALQDLTPIKITGGWSPKDGSFSGYDLTFSVTDHGNGEHVLVRLPYAGLESKTAYFSNVKDFDPNADQTSFDFNVTFKERHVERGEMNLYRNQNGKMAVKFALNTGIEYAANSGGSASKLKDSPRRKRGTTQQNEPT